VTALSSLLIAAQAPAAGAAQPSGLMQLMPLGIIVIIFYFLLIRPQQKQAKQHQAFLKSVKKGDEVVTNSGIIGKVHTVASNIVTLEVARDVRVRVLIHQVANRYVAAEEEAKDSK
jgi:preprotein translocase subunit YajC